MINIDNYSIEQFPAQNAIVIYLPQTNDTVTNTLVPIRNRKKTLNESELSVILNAAKCLFESAD